MTATKALTGTRVIDLTQFEAGTSCTQMLGWLGADVIKIEPPGRGDPGRKVATDPRSDRDGFYFLTLNANKRSVTLDLKQPEGRRLLLELIRRADVVVENQGPGVLERLDLGYDAMKAANPRVIVARLKGFGTWGPYQDFKSFDIIAQATGGSACATGPAGGPPMRAGINIADLGSGMQLVIGILAALLQRQQTQAGQQVEISMQDAVVNLARVWSARYLESGESPPRRGNGNGKLKGAYRCMPGGDDDYVAVFMGPGTPKMIEEMLRTIGREDLAADASTHSMAWLGAHAEEVDACIEAWTLRHTKQDAMRILAAAGVPAGATLNAADLFQDPHLIARDMVVKVRHPQRGEITLPGCPIKLDASPVEFRPPPLLGEHTGEVLRELLSFTDADLARLHADGLL